VFLEVFPVGPIQANCVLIGDLEAGVLAVIDPGGEAERIHDRVTASGLQPAMILHTHGHIDHAGGTADLVRRFEGEIPVGLHRDELDLYRGLGMQARMFGLEVESPPEPSLWLEHGQAIDLGGLTLEVRHTPGHSPGGVVFVVCGAPEPTAIVGDVLFAGSIGRTDLFGGSFPVLERSIREQLYTLPDQTRIITGHGPDTTVGRERSTNPFVRG
jgi:glyoxylase-like metal-dependent hydrolase (beta-lactamase superfamily II)